MGNQDCVEMAVALAATDISDVCVHGVMESDRKGVEIEAKTRTARVSSGPDGRSEGGATATELRMNRVQEKLKNRTTLLGAGGDDRPDPFAPAAAGFAARPSGDMPVNHHKADRLLGEIAHSSDKRLLAAASWDRKIPILAVRTRSSGCLLHTRMLANSWGT